MKWIVITSPGYYDGEDLFIRTLLSCGVDLIHLRKPGGDRDSCERLLESLSGSERARIVTHDFLDLAEPYGLKGVHLNRRNPEAPGGFSGTVSRSCHSLEEVKEVKDRYDYVFLSPVFDSISKEGYRSAFSAGELDEAARTGLIDRKVAALGGVTPQRLPRLEGWHFGGAAMLGCVNSMSGLPQDILRARLCKIREMFGSMEDGIGQS